MTNFNIRSVCLLAGLLTLGGFATQASADSITQIDRDKLVLTLERVSRSEVYLEKTVLLLNSSISHANTIVNESKIFSIMGRIVMAVTKIGDVLSSDDKKSIDAFLIRIATGKITQAQYASDRLKLEQIIKELNDEIVVAKNVQNLAQGILSTGDDKNLSELHANVLSLAETLNLTEASFQEILDRNFKKDKSLKIDLN